jgi:hypothetical protein
MLPGRDAGDRGEHADMIGNRGRGPARRQVPGVGDGRRVDQLEAGQERPELGGRVVEYGPAVYSRASLGWRLGSSG